MADIGQDIDRAKELLLHNDIVGIPTETVYGLAGNALNEEVILKIYEVKNRPKFDPFIAHTNALEKMEPFIKEIPDRAGILASQFWPGPLTLLLEKKDSIPDLLTSGNDRVAIRIPNHPLILRLLEQLNFPLAAPSANPFGYVSPTTAHHVNTQLGSEISYILDGGECNIGVESTIIGFENEEPIVYRLGGIPIESIEEIIGRVKLKINMSSDPSAPGMLKSHYSPGRKIRIGNIEEHLKQMNSETTGVISFQHRFNVPSENLFILSERGDLLETARNIFKALREMDKPHIKEILVEFVPDHGLGKAVNDRLRRSAVINT